MDKRRLLNPAMRRVLASAALCLASAAGFSNPARAENIKVGMILTYSGPNAALGEFVDRGVKLYVKLHGSELPPGTTVEIIRRDDTGPNPDVAKRLAQELIVRDQVHILAGGQFTPNAMAIGAMTKQAKIPFVVMVAGGSDVTAQSPYVVRTSRTLWQSSYPLGQWAAKKGYKTAYTVVSDYAPGHDAESAFVKAFTDGGGKIVGSIRVPMKTTDYLPYLQKAKDAAPDVLFHFNTGGPVATAYMKAMSDVGIIGSKTKVMGPGDITSDEELVNMGRSPLGVITAFDYSAAATRKANQEFLAAWKREYGADSVPNFFAVGGWDGIKAIYDAIRAQKGKADPDATIAYLRNWKDPNSPRGPVQIDAATGDIVQHEYIRQVEEHGGRLANVEIETLPQVGDPQKLLKGRP